MRPITPVSPANANCRLRGSTTGTDGAWPIQVSAVIQTHPDTTPGAKTVFNRAYRSRGCSLAIGSPHSAPRNTHAQHERRSPNPHSAC
jgi:hypothetical protein